MRERLFDVDDRTVFRERVLALRRAHQTHGHERPTRLDALAICEITATLSVVIGVNDLILGEPVKILLSQEEDAVPRKRSPTDIGVWWFGSPATAPTVSRVTVNRRSS